MNLLVDIGNARIKWALQSTDDLQTGQPMLREGKAFKDIARPAWKELDAPERIVIANVAGGEYEKSVITWLKRRWKVAPEFLRATGTELGVTNAYKEPGRLGADRWACLLAAHAACDVPVIVVDCGTAITIDALTADGRHLGGLIAPGIDLMTASLSSRAPGIEILNNENRDIALLGGSTEVGVAGGVLYTAVSLVDRVFTDLRAELGKSARQIITGGDALRITPLLSTQPLHEPDLVLKGLAAYAVATAVAEESPDNDNEPVAREAAVCDS